MVYLPAKESAGQNYEALKAELLNESSILAVSAKNGLPTERADGGVLYPKGEEPDELYTYEVSAVDYDFMDILELEIVSGRNFSKEYPSDAKNACILNERGAQILGVESPLGTEVFTNKGVKTVPQTLVTIESAWKKINPNVPFEYHFLDDAYDRLYSAEKRLSTSFNIFSLFAIFISCIGLHGLSSFMAERKTKEIGIRKVMGASLGEVVVLLSRQFVKWIFAANLIA